MRSGRHGTNEMLTGRLYLYGTQPQYEYCKEEDGGEGIIGLQTASAMECARENKGAHL